MLVLDLEIWENGNNFTSDQFGDDTMNNESAEIIELKKKIEKSVERVMHTPADFDFLSGAIWERIREYISPTTLKRTWGYLDGVKQIRYSTLEILSRFAGFKSWDNYLAERKISSEQNSNIVTIGVVNASELAEGDTVSVEWAPNRRVSFKHLGSCRFEVTESVWSHLDVGDTASVMLFVIDEPLLLSDLNHRGKTGLTYLCGGKGGLTALRTNDLASDLSRTLRRPPK